MKVSEAFNKAADRMLYTSDSSWVMPEVRIGLEFEFENPQGKRHPGEESHPDFWAYWTMGDDGSLRDHGLELKFRQPLFGQDLTRALNTAQRWCDGDHVVENYRTGLHVHLDCRSLELAELRRLLIFYAIYEGAFFEFAGRERLESNFCIPWSRVNDHMDTIKSAFREGTSISTIQSQIKGLARYSALNLNALSQFGSVEFRHLQMTKDFNRIKYWINSIMALMKAANINSPYGPSKIGEVDLIRYLGKDGAHTVAREIFPPDFSRYLVDAQIWNGTLIAKELAFDPVVKGTFSKVANFGGCPKGKFRGYTRFLEKTGISAPAYTDMMSKTYTGYAP